MIHGLLPDTLGPLLPPTLKRLSLANRPPDDMRDAMQAAGRLSASVQVCQVVQRAAYAFCPRTRNPDGHRLVS